MNRKLMYSTFFVVNTACALLNLSIFLGSGEPMSLIIGLFNGVVAYWMYDIRRKL